MREICITMPLICKPLTPQHTDKKQTHKYLPPKFDETLTLDPLGRWTTSAWLRSC